MLVHATPREARLRPFIAFGGGIKYYRGTGAEQEFQPLQNFAVLTRTSEWLPMLSVGGGVKFRIAKHALVRFDFRDYMTPFPTRVILPAGGSSVSGWLHDLTPMVGISAFF
jgi:TPP-dependent trihydroxycyclohexane-1,2-dione (THcHDO) dehydratase